MVTVCSTIVHFFFFYLTDWIGSHIAKIDLPLPFSHLHRRRRWKRLLIAFRAWKEELEKPYLDGATVPSRRGFLQFPTMAMSKLGLCSPQGFLCFCSLFLLYSVLLLCRSCLLAPPLYCSLLCWPLCSTPLFLLLLLLIACYCRYCCCYSAPLLYCCCSVLLCSGSCCSRFPLPVLSFGSHILFVS